jgi:hypothetical protein
LDLDAILPESPDGSQANTPNGRGSAKRKSISPKGKTTPKGKKEKEA